MRMIVIFFNISLNGMVLAIVIQACVFWSLGHCAALSRLRITKSPSLS